MEDNKDFINSCFNWDIKSEIDYQINEISYLPYKDRKLFLQTIIRYCKKCIRKERYKK